MNMMTFEQMSNEQMLKNEQKNSYTHITLKINGELSHCNITSSEEFKHMLINLYATPFMDDEQKYWVLYEDHEDGEGWSAFWCIPVEEINFIFDEESSCVGYITLDEDDEEEIVLIEEAEVLDKISDFRCNLSYYMLYDKRADVDTFRLWKAFDNFVNGAEDDDVRLDNEVCFINWLEHNWNAFFECIIDDNFKYINVAGMVLESWEEFCR